MRPSFFLSLVLLSLLVSGVFIQVKLEAKRQEGALLYQEMQSMVETLGVSDLCLSTEARYTRHPAVSDTLVVGMDHPGALDHFPSTLFWSPDFIE